ncbi:MAG: hypothetical protein OEU26_09280, partial [Candidatus Tectomicrobia bacterium]|nr:hypothetical protein [Candidatus Tectomicrobia bacterium]
IQRFSHGIVNGLNVTLGTLKDSPNEPAFIISEGLAVDEAGNSIVVGSEGLRIPVSEFFKEKGQDQEEGQDQDHLFLSLRYEEKKTFVTNSVKESSKKNNRIIESVQHKWDKVENARISIGNVVFQHITLARIRQVEDSEELVVEEEIGNKTFRTSAGIISEDQLDKNIKDKLVTRGDAHNHTDGEGGPIPEDGLDPNVKLKLVTGGNTHNHDGGDGARILLGGLADEVIAKLVDDGNRHNHDEGGGRLIPETGLNATVRGKLVTGGDNHDHSSARAGKVSLAGLDPDVTDKLVTGGDNHDHSSARARKIPLTGLDPDVTDKLVTGGDNHDHSSAGAKQIPLAGLAPDATDKLVTGGDDHDHTNAEAKQIPLAGLALDVTEKFVTMADVTPGGGTLSIAAGVTSTETIAAVEKHAIIYVVPSQGVLSWTFTAVPDGDNLRYTIVFVNSGNTVAVCEVKKFVFGTG